MTFDEYKKQWVGKSVDFDGAYGIQCVDQARHFAQLVHGQAIGSFGGSALTGWQTGKPFTGKPYVRVNYVDGLIPPRGAIVFFDKTTKNPYGHVAVTGTCTKDELRVIEQNAAQGDGDGAGGDEISIRMHKYKGDGVGNCLGRFIHYHQY